ncbi:MAG: PAS domain-containing protein [Phycisphaerales bacterium]|nr:MAG: PAS domain-containing protein [Phycisphaerales bacterium]
MKRKGGTTKRGPRGEQDFEEQLRACEEKLKVLLDSVSSGVAVYEARNDGEDFVFVDFNRAAEEIEEVNRADVIGRSVSDVFPGVKEFGLFDVFRRVWRTGVPEHHPVSVYRDERIAGWRENYVHRLSSGAIVAVYDDVTTAKRSELAARMSEQCFVAIANYTYDWEVWVAPSGRVLWTNPSASRVTGYTIKELTAMADYPKQIVYAEDRERIGRAFASALRGSTGNDVQFRIERKGGKMAWVEMSWQPICDDKGNSLGHRESIRDITARKEVEAALEQAEREKEMILDSLTEQVIYEDKEMGIIWANRAACESVAMTRDQIVGRHCYELLAEGGRTCVDCPVVRAMESGRMEEGERRTGDGRVWFVQGSPVRDKRGEITGAVEIALDITERKRAEEALRQSEEKYRQLVEGGKR